jgi:hypothetical protein
MKFDTQSAEWISVRIITCIISPRFFFVIQRAVKYDNGKRYL